MMVLSNQGECRVSQYSPLPVVDLPLRDSHTVTTVSIESSVIKLTLRVIMISFIHVIVFPHLFVYAFYHIHLQ